MIGWFIENEEVGIVVFFIQRCRIRIIFRFLEGIFPSTGIFREHCEEKSRSFSSREGADFFGMVHVFESVRFEDASDAFGRIEESVRCEILEDCAICVKRLVHLREVQDLRVFVELDESFEGFDLLEDRLEKGTFSDAVFPDDPDAFPFGEFCMPHEKQRFLSPDEGIFDLEGIFRSVFVVCEREFDESSRFRFFEDLDFFEGAFATFCPSGTGSSTKSVDEFFLSFDECLLFFVIFFVEELLLFLFRDAE